MRKLRLGLLGLLGILAAATAAISIVFGGGRRAVDRTTEPLLPGSVLEVVANLELPPGNVAVSAENRVFFTFHPEADPQIQLAELVDGKPMPYPNAAFQKPGDGREHFQSLLSVRVDRQNRLWALDFAGFGTGQPRIFAFDLASDRLVDVYDFPRDVAPLGSMLNDFQVDPAGKRITIADSSLFNWAPAIVVYDVERKTSRRILEKHPAVAAKPYVLAVGGRDMVFLGILPLTIGVDSIALDRRGEWLYFGPVSDERMYRIRAADLADESLDEAALGSRVEDFGSKPLSDGLSSDLENRIYVTAPEHDAILTLGPDRELRTLVKDERLRWPDGLSFGPDGWLYVTCSALHHVILRSDAHVRSRAPFQIYRFRPGAAGIPGA